MQLDAEDEGQPFYKPAGEPSATSAGADDPSAPVAREGETQAEAAAVVTGEQEG
jgi:hypothetical protein